MGVSTASTCFTTTNVPVTTAGAEISTASPESDYVDDIAAESLVYIGSSASKTKDKGKGIMEESESAMTKTKRQKEQERLGYEAALRLQEQLDEEERQMIARAHEAASSFNFEEWEDIQARIEADKELAQRLQVEEREKYSEAEKARLLAELINQRKRHFAQQRAEERRNKPPIQTQQRTYMSNYIKHMGSYTLQQLRGYSFDEIKSLFEATMKRVNTFTPMESDVDRTVPKIAAGSTKRAAEEELGQQSSKKQKSDELSQEELQQLMIIVPEEGMNIEALQTKYPIIDWEVELKRLFEPNADDALWKSQKHIHDITWRLYDTYGVHHVSTKDGINIYKLVEREYPLSRGVLTQMLVAKLLVEQNRMQGDKTGIKHSMHGLTQNDETNGNAVTEPNYDAKAVSEVNASHKVYEQENHVKRKTIIHTSNDDQIDSNIIFDDPYVENNGGTSEHDSNTHDKYHDIQILAYNVQREVENQK
ncbi:hypothetical protein Tco_0472871 [Tanacetum coccineum]